MPSWPLVLTLVLSLMSPLMEASESVVVTTQNINSLLSAKNAKVTATRLEKSAALEREGSLVRSFLPSVALQGGQERFKTGVLSQKDQPTLSAEVKVNIFNGWQDKIEDDFRELETKRLEFQEQRVHSEELEKARSQFWKSLYLQEKITLLKSTLLVNNQNLTAAQRRVRGGVATDSDRFEFEMKEVDLKREIAETEVDLAAQTRQLEILLGIGDGKKIVFSEALAHDHDFESALKRPANQRDFLFKEFEIQAQQQSLSADAHRRAWWPRVEAYLAYHEFNQRIESAGPEATEDMRKETALGLKMTMSLSAGFESYREGRAAQSKALASQALADYQKREVDAELQTEVAELKNLHDQVHEAEQNISRAEKYYKITQSEYARGVKNSPDVLGASEKLFDMRHRRLEIIRKFQLAKVHIMSKVGE
jgi:outer membrane protein